MSGMEPFLFGSAAIGGEAATAGLIGAKGAFDAGMALKSAGTILAGTSAITSGIHQKVSGDFQAKQLEAKANEERAASQRVAEEKRRKANQAMSRANALAAASGGGATDPTVVNIMAGIAEEGEWGAQTAQYMGEERARTSEMAATSTRMSGRNALTAGFTGGSATILGGIGESLLKKYSPTGGAFSSSKN